MITDVVDVAWRAIGSPVVEPATLPRGRCARCGNLADLVATSRAVSKFYRSWDLWHDPHGAGVCPACLWSFRAPLLRSVPHWVHHDPAILSPLSPEALTAQLSRPLGTSEAIVLPLRPGRRHLIHHAHWGTITTDDGALPWSGGDVERLGAYQQLRRLGLRHQQILLAAPPFQILRRLDPDQVSDVLDLWPCLDLWRTSPAWAAIASRTITLEGHPAA